MKGAFNISNIYTLLWCIYYYQGATTTEASTIGRVSLMVALMISFYYLYLCLAKLWLPRLLKALNWLLLLFTLYGAYRLIPGTEVKMGGVTIARIDYLKNIYISILPIYTYYYFTVKGYIDKQWFMKWSIVFIGIAIYSFYGYQLKRYSEFFGFNDFSITNNTAYLFVAILPALVFYKRYPYVQYPLFFLVSAFTLFGVKRGALLILFMCLFFYIQKSRTRETSKANFFYFIIVAVFVIYGITELLHFYETNEYLQLRTEETIGGESSHRDELYSGVISYYFNQTNILCLFLGNGANATITIAGKNAHNDWLEILINQGFIGLCFFTYYWYVFFITCKKAYRKGKTDEMGLALIFVFIICFTKTLFSMSINDMNVFITSVLGFCLYNIEGSDNYYKTIRSNGKFISKD